MQTSPATTSQEAHTPAGGSLVDVRGDRWRLIDTTEHGGCSTCRLAGASSTNVGVRRTLLLPFDRLRPVPVRSRLRRVGRARWMVTLRSALAATCRHDSLRGAAGAAIDLLPFQLEPALACARGATRLLLADEVGLGKTVQAGLILADLRTRDESTRALVLCPAGLCGQWRQELEGRFQIAARIVDRPELRRLLASAADAGPWEQVRVAIASFDFVKRPEVSRTAESAHWDLVVVDEAHLCALAPERAAAVHRLATNARRVVLLTATPHPGEPGAFEALGRIGRLPGEGPTLVFRRTRAELGLASGRRCRLLSIAPSPHERRLHTLLERYTSDVWDAARAGRAPSEARLAMIALRKRAASGAASLLASLGRRLHWLSSAAEAADSQLPLPFEDGDEPEAADEEPGLALAAPGLPDADAERRMLQRLADLAAAAVPIDSKSRALARLLRRVREPAIVFTEYRDTLAHLEQTCRGIRGLATIHGGMDRNERAQAVGAFNRGEATLLLATDAAAHGLNLQATCRLVVSLELPWNPVRLEQRIGRVDRIGQRRTVHAIHLVARRTSEAEILGRLAARIERAKREFASATDPLGTWSELDIAEAVFARRPPDGRRHAGTDGESGPGRQGPRAIHSGDGASFQACALAAAARDEADRLKLARSLVRRRRGAFDAATAPSGPCFTVLRWRRPPHGADGIADFATRGTLLAVYEAELADGRGLPLERVLTVVLWRGPHATPPDRRKAAVSLDPCSPLLDAMQRAAARGVDGRLAELRAVLPSRFDALNARLLAMANAGADPPLVPYQPGLFDRRALRRADLERRLREARRAETESELAAAGRAATVSLAGSPRLLLVAVVES